MLCNATGMIWFLRKQCPVTWEPVAGVAEGRGQTRYALSRIPFSERFTRESKCSMSSRRTAEMGSSFKGIWQSIFVRQDVVAWPGMKLQHLQLLSERQKTWLRDSPVQTSTTTHDSTGRVSSRAKHKFFRWGLGGGEHCKKSGSPTAWYARCGSLSIP